MQEKSNSYNLGPNHIIRSESHLAVTRLLWSGRQVMSCPADAYLKKTSQWTPCRQQTWSLSASTIIYNLVIDCLNLFEKFSSQNINGRVYFRLEAAENSMIPPRLLIPDLKRFAYLQKRFEIRTSYTGAVADNPDLSLDTRLGLDWKTRSMVVGLLHSI